MTDDLDRHDPLGSHTPHSYLSRRISPDGPLDLPEAQSHLVSNKPLFLLRVTVIGLFHGCLLEDLRTSEDVNASDDFVTTVQTTLRVRDGLASESGQRYIDVVSHCIRCPYKTTSTSLDNLGFSAGCHRDCRSATYAGTERL